MEIFFSSPYFDVINDKNDEKECSVKIENFFDADLALNYKDSLFFKKFNTKDLHPKPKQINSKYESFSHKNNEIIVDYKMVINSENNEPENKFMTGICSKFIFNFFVNNFDDILSNFKQKYQYLMKSDQIDFNFFFNGLKEILEKIGEKVCYF